MGDVLTDPELGEMRRRGDAWTLRLMTLNVTVLGADFTPPARAAVLAFRDHFERLMSEGIADELVAIETNANRKTPRDEIFDVYKVVGATIEVVDGRVLVEVGFEPRWSGDHYVTVFLRDWARAGSAIDS